MGQFRMPSLGADMDVGTIVEWLVQPGEPVKRGQIVAVVDTAKAAIEIEAFENGVLEEILVQPGIQVAVGTPLAVIGAGAAAAAAEGEPVVGEPVAEAEAAAVGEPVDAGAATPVGSPAVPLHPRAAPPLRHLAHQLGVDLDAIEGSGPGGHITHDDVLAAVTVQTGADSHAAAGGQEAAADGGEAAAALPKRGPRSKRAKRSSAGRPAAGAAASAPASAPPVGTGAPRLRVTPRARRLAAERGVDLSTVEAADAALTGADVERAVQGSAAPGAPVGKSAQQVPSAGTGAAPAVPSAGSPATPAAASPADRKAAMRTAIANLMSRSNAEIPHYYVTQTVDLGPALAWLRTHNADLPPASRLVPAALFLRATVLAALAVPDLNGHWVDGGLRPADQVDLGVAVAQRGGGLVTPAIPDAGPLGVDDLMARLSDLVARSRRGTLKRAEMAGASITVSSLGETGPDALYGVIFPPQVALVGIGGIVERPWAVDGMLTVRPTVTVALAADHRASDGRTGSAFLAAFAHAMAQPEEL